MQTAFLIPGSTYSTLCHFFLRILLYALGYLIHWCRSLKYGGGILYIHPFHSLHPNYSKCKKIKKLSTVLVRCRLACVCINLCSPFLHSTVYYCFGTVSHRGLLWKFLGLPPMVFIFIAEFGYVKRCYNMLKIKWYKITVLGTV